MKSSTNGKTTYLSDKSPATQSAAVWFFRLLRWWVFAMLALMLGGIVVSVILGQ